ncbi:hypothetical protein GQ472_01930 [archaeon]|nr:hypothetical protein [archaeon]
MLIEKYDTWDTFDSVMNVLLRLEAEKYRILSDSPEQVPAIQYILMEVRLQDIEMAQQKGLDYVHGFLERHFAGC